MEGQEQATVSAPETTVSTENNGVETNYSQAQLEHFAFGTPLPAAPAEISQEQGEIQDTTVTTSTTDTTNTTTVAPSEVTIDDKVYLKEQTGYEDWNQLKADIESYKALKDTPQTQAEIKYANEESKRIHEAILAGNTKEVRDYLNAQELLSGVDTMNDEQRLKLYIKMQNPLFSDRLVNEEFQDQYHLDEESIDESKLERERLKLEQRKINDVKSANEYFTKYKTQIELPTIEKQIAQQQATVDESYETFKASNAKAIEDYNNVVLPAINALKESDVALNISINDANNQMQFDVSVMPEKTDFDRAKNAAADFGTHIQTAFYDEKGNFLASKLQRAILLEQNFDKYAQSIARQAVNAERKRVVSTNAPATQTQRSYTVEDPANPLLDLEKFAFQGIRGN